MALRLKVLWTVGVRAGITHTWPAEWPSWGSAVNKGEQTVPGGWQGGVVMPGGKEASKRSIWF